MRIVSINSGKGDGAYRRRLELLGDGLTSLAPDIVLVQEALKSADGSLDTMRSLANRLSLHPSFAPARFKSREVEGEWFETWSGMGLLSKTQPDETLPVELPRDERDGDRIALVARFGGLAIANLHLTHLRGAEADALRRAQIEKVLSAQSLIDASSVIIGGDFNTGLVSITGLLDGIGNWRAIDAFGSQITNRATVPVTASLDNGYCVDFIFAMTRPGEKTPAFSDSHIVLGDSDADGVYPSDHRGIMTTVSFNNDLEQAQ